MAYDEDVLAERLRSIAMSCRGMTPAFEAGMSYPVMSFSGDVIGMGLPGKGVYVNRDLGRLGIRKQIPYVFERSRFMRLFDRLHYDEVGAITKYEDILDARATGGGINGGCKSSDMIAVNNGNFFDGGRQTGYPTTVTASAATTPPTDAARSATNGGLLKCANTTMQGSEKLFLCSLGMAKEVGSGSEVSPMMYLVDCLVTGGVFRTTVLTEEIIASPTAVTRQYGPSSNLGTGACLTFTVQTATSFLSGGSTATLKYNNELNAAQTIARAKEPSGIAAGGIISIGQGQGSQTNIPWVPLEVGDKGIRSFKSMQLDIVDPGSGTLLFRIVQPLIIFPPHEFGLSERDFTAELTGLIPLPTDGSGVPGCLMHFEKSTTTGQVYGHSWWFEAVKI